MSSPATPYGPSAEKGSWNPPQAVFLKGAVSPKQFPLEDRAEIAFAGRSNVGKSMLLNQLLNRRNLARVSRTPGRTREINFFEVGTLWSFVDLPGYGYAKVAKSQRSVWDQTIGGYFEYRRNLRAVILLLDIRRGVTDLDHELLIHLDQLGIPCLPVATKVDKIKVGPRHHAQKNMEISLKEASHFILTPAVMVSSLKGEGISTLWQRLTHILRPLVENEVIHQEDNNP